MAKDVQDSFKQDSHQREEDHRSSKMSFGTMFIDISYSDRKLVLYSRPVVAEELLTSWNSSFAAYGIVNFDTSFELLQCWHQPP